MIPAVLLLIAARGFFVFKNEPMIPLAAFTFSVK